MRQATARGFVRLSAWCVSRSAPLERNSGEPCIAVRSREVHASRDASEVRASERESAGALERRTHSAQVAVHQAPDAPRQGAETDWYQEALERWAAIGQGLPWWATNPNNITFPDVPRHDRVTLVVPIAGTTLLVCSLLVVMYISSWTIKLKAAAPRAVPSIREQRSRAFGRPCRCATQRQGGGSIGWSGLGVRWARCRTGRSNRNRGYVGGAPCEQLLRAWGAQRIGADLEVMATPHVVCLARARVVRHRSRPRRRGTRTRPGGRLHRCPARSRIAGWSRRLHPRLRRPSRRTRTVVLGVSGHG